MLILGFACAPHVPMSADPVACAECHAPQTASWTGSPHAEAHDGPLFTVSFAEQRASWCLDCHAEGGVTCATCHGPDAKTCVDCHEFELPAEVDERGRVAYGSGILAQSTGTEWRSSSFAERSCASCHPPHGGDDVRSRLRASVRVRVRADGDRVHANVTTSGVGHALPTGDPFRRFELRICSDLACDRPVATSTLQRRLDRGDDGSWRLAFDTRVPAPGAGDTAERGVDLLAPGARSWRLTYHLADPRHESRLGDAARFVVATGLVESP